MANNSISLVAADFDLLKSNLRTYLQSQSIFRDYDFEGSNLNVLLDILAFNTHQNVFYLNMLASESFLDSARLRGSVVSRAKELNYTPRSARSAAATIELDFWSYTQSLSVPIDTSFSTVVAYRSFSFVTDENRISVATESNTVTSGNAQVEVYHHVIEDVRIYEGSYVTETYVIDSSLEAQRFYISNPMVDTSSLQVTVTEDGGSTVLDYTPETTLLGVRSDSRVFFIQQSADARYEIVFGDGVLGRAPKNSATVSIRYRICSGENPNRAFRFTIDDDITGGTLYGPMTVNVSRRAEGGSLPETLESIRFNAPLHFQVQERAIVPSDYELMLTQQFPEIASVAAFGGEDLSPPRFGKVYIAVDITDVDGLPDIKKLEYRNFISQRTNMTPVFIEPEFTYVEVRSLVRYNINTTRLRPSDIESIVSTAIATFADTNLNTFKSTLRYSQLVTAIDDAHESIVGNETSLRMYKILDVDANDIVNATVDFDTPLAADSFKVVTGTVDSVRCIDSSPFLYSGELCNLADDGNGVLSIVKTAGGRVSVIRTVGTVDYTTGRLSLVNFRYDGLVGTQRLKVFAQPASLDVASTKQVILEVEDEGIDVTAVSIRE